MDNGIQNQLNFPRDHYFHGGKYSIEWHYFWGRLSNNASFYFTEQCMMFGSARVKYIHYGIDNKYFEEMDTWKSDIISSSGFTGNKFFFRTPKLQLTFNKKSNPVIHSRNIEGSNYYSIPYLEGEGIYNGKKITATAWFDHEFSNWSLNILRKVGKWDWIGIQLDTGIFIMAWISGMGNICDVTFDGKTVVTDFALSEEKVEIPQFGISLNIKPLFKEKVFKPMIGIKYSEQPFDVVFKERVIGCGMRERVKVSKKEN